MFSKSSKWEMGFVHFIARFTILRFVISRFEVLRYGWIIIFFYKYRRYVYLLVIHIFRKEIQSSWT